MKNLLSVFIGATVLIFGSLVRATDFRPEHRHPGHLMEVSYLPTKEYFVQGEPVVVSLKIKNVGPTVFKFERGGSQRGARDNKFSFTASLAGRAIPDVGQSLNFGGMSYFVQLKPSESIEIPVDLRGWFLLDQVGEYRIIGSYQMGFGAPEISGYSLIWVDFATATFQVVIRADKAKEANQTSEPTAPSGRGSP